MQAFWDLDAGRSMGGFAMSRITWADMQAYAASTGQRFHACDFDMLRHMEERRFAAMEKKKPARKTTPEGKSRRRPRREE